VRVRASAGSTGSTPGLNWRNLSSVEEAERQILASSVFSGLATWSFPSLPFPGTARPRARPGTPAQRRRPVAGPSSGTARLRDSLQGQPSFNQKLACSHRLLCAESEARLRTHFQLPSPLEVRKDAGIGSFHCLVIGGAKRAVPPWRLFQESFQARTCSHGACFQVLPSEVIRHAPCVSSTYSFLLLSIMPHAPFSCHEAPSVWL